MSVRVPSYLLLPNLPKYQALFSPEDQLFLSKINKNVMIINESFNYQNFLSYHQRYQPDFILPSDISKAEAAGLIDRLKMDSDETSILQKDLIERFRKSILEKISVMFTALDNHQFNILQTEAHKIAGSASCYGYKTLGDVARAMDVYLDTAHSVNDTTKMCSSLLRKMLFAFQKIAT